MTDHENQMGLWRRLQDASEGDPEIEMLDELEVAILMRPPTTLPQALDLIEVIRTNVIDGGRPDGLDADALTNLRRALSALVDERQVMMA